MSLLNKQIQNVVELIHKASYTVVLTGAGISTRSGIPDFRSSDGGLWQQFDPMEVASLSAFRTHPERFFAWFRPLAKTVLEAKPNAAHYAFASMEKEGLVNDLITQNIDTLHHSAGTTKIHEVHGTTLTLTCTHCYLKQKAAAYIEKFVFDGSIPLCPDCSSILKPDVILFEEQLPFNVWQKAKKSVEKCDLMIVAGSSLEVLPVSGLPYKVLSQEGKLIILNQTSTYLDDRADVVIREDLVDSLPAIIEKL